MTTNTEHSQRDNSLSRETAARPLRRTEHNLPRLTFTWHWKVPLLYLAFLFTLNAAFPMIMYYPLRAYTNLSLHALIGISSALLGLSSCFDAPYRLWKLVKYRERYGPLPIEGIQPKWWHLDWSMWYYTFSMAFFAIPLAIAPALELYSFFLFSSAMLVSPAVLVLIISLVPLRYPFPISSDPPRVKNKPGAFYVLEDVVAVDFGYGRQWRTELHERYNASRMFRTHMWWQTFYWIVAGSVYVGATAAVAWTTSLDFAFAFVLGQFFVWFVIACFGSYVLGRWWNKREKQWWVEQHGTSAVKEKPQQGGASAV